jgi:uncharacterized protein (UPF0335 family)
MSDDRLRLFVERIERISAEIAGLQEDRRDVYAEAKAVGYDAAVLRMVIARRAAPPDVRAEADAMVAAYEAALGGGAPDPAVDPETASRELAIAILADQIEGISEPDRAALLVDHVRVLLDLRAEIAGLRDMEKGRKALAEAEGFDKAGLTRVVRWIEQVMKHGSDAMRAGEAVFQLYRGTVEGRGLSGAPITNDPKLQPLVKGPPSVRPAPSRLAWFDAGGN